MRGSGRASTALFPSCEPWRGGLAFAERGWGRGGRRGVPFLRVGKGVDGGELDLFCKSMELLLKR